MLYRFSHTLFLIIMSGCLLQAATGRVEKTSFYSSALGIEKGFNIYLPEGYDDSDQRYPVVYLCRGHEDEYLNHTEIIDWVDKSIEAGKLGRMILVFPGLTYEGNGLVGFPVNMNNAEPLGVKEGLGSGRFEDYFVQDLIPYVDRTYRTIAAREARGIDGFSAGAISSILLAVKHPELFLTAGAYDGPWGYLDFDDPMIPGETDDSVWMYLDQFDPFFGDPRNMSFMKSCNSSNIIHEAEGEHLDLIRSVHFYVCATSKDARSAFIEGSYYQRTIHLVQVMESKGIRNQWEGESIILSPDSDHTYAYAQKYFEITLPMHWKILSQDNSN